MTREALEPGTRGLGSLAARGALHTVLGQVAVTVLRVANLAVLARLISPSTFGSFAIVNSIVLFCSAIVFFGLPMAVASFRRLSNTEESALFYINTGLGAVMSLTLLAASAPVAATYGDGRLESMLAIASAVPLLLGIQVQWRSRLTVDLRFGQLAIIEIVGQSAALVTGIMFAVDGRPALALAGMLVAQALAQVAACLYFSRWLPGSASGSASTTLILVRRGSLIFLGNVLKNLQRTALIPLMGISLNPASLGLYDRAQQLAVMPLNMTLDRMQRVGVPVLTRLRSDHDRFQFAVAQMQSLSSYAFGTGFMVLAATAEPITIIVLGEAWVSAAPILAVLSLGAAFRAMSQATYWVYLAQGRVMGGLVFMAWSQPLALVVALLGVPWGAIGVAIAGSIAWLIIWPLSVMSLSRSMALAPWPLVRSALRPLVLMAIPVASICSLTSRTGPDLPILNLLVVLGAGALTGICCLAVFRSVRDDLLMHYRRLWGERDVAR